MKSQSEIIATVLIVLISIGLVSAAYLWGFPLIEKKQDISKLDRVSAYFSQSVSSSLPNIIENVVNLREESEFQIDVNGIWKIIPDEYDTPYNNSLSFSFFSKVSNVAVNKGWISLTPGESCPPSSGIIGEDTASVVCERAESASNGFNITYIIFFRSLNQSGTNLIYRISLNKSINGPYTSTGKKLRISYAGTEEKKLDNGKKLIITKVNILLS